MTTKTIKPLNKGVQAGLLDESPTAAGSSTVEYSVQTDGTLVTLFVSAISGTLNVVVYGLSETRTITLFSFPTISATTPTLLALRAPVSTSRIRVVATYSAACTYQIQGRGTDGGLSHNGPVPDSVLLGDGVDIAEVIGGQLQVSGNVRPRGLNIAGRVTVVAVNSTTWTALPVAPLANRNAMCIQNQGITDIKLSYDSATVGYVGVLVSSGAERFYDITDTIPIYAKCAAGSGYSVYVEELS